MRSFSRIDDGKVGYRPVEAVLGDADFWRISAVIEAPSSVIVVMVCSEVAGEDSGGRMASALSSSSESSITFRFVMLRYPHGSSRQLPYKGQVSCHHWS